MSSHKFKQAKSQEILNLDHQKFAALLKDKIFLTNSNFSEDYRVINKMVQYVWRMQPSKDNLKIMRELLKFYQLPIIFFFKQFYNKVQKQIEYFKQSTEEKAEKTIKKILQILQQTSGIYMKILQKLKHTDKITYFSYLTQYQCSHSEQDNLEVIFKDYQSRYIQIYDEVFKQYEYIMLSSQIQSFQRQLFIEQLEEFIQQNKVNKKNIKLNFQDILESLMLEQMIESVSQEKSEREVINEKKQMKQISQPKEHVVQMNGLKQKQSFIKSGQKQFKQLSGPLCCRTSFESYQKIIELQTAILEYKNYKYPYEQSYCQNNLLKTIVGFLNRAGGTILIGISEASDRYKQVKGQFLTENDKQALLTDFRYMCQDISPDIICNAKCSVKFVPIRQQNSRKYIEGKYIVRISVKPGNKGEFYSYKQRGDRFVKNQFICIRTTNQVLRRQINQNILAIYRQRLLYPEQYESLHKGECAQPQIGAPINYLDWRQNSQFRDEAEDYQDEYCKREQNKYIEKNNKNKKEEHKIRYKENKIESKVKAEKDDEMIDFVSKKKKKSKGFIVDQESEEGQKNKFQKQNLVNILKIVNNQDQQQEYPSLIIKSKNNKVSKKDKSEQNKDNKQRSTNSSQNHYYSNNQMGKKNYKPKNNNNLNNQRRQIESKAKQDKKDNHIREIVVYERQPVQTIYRQNDKTIQNISIIKPLLKDKDRLEILVMSLPFQVVKQMVEMVELPLFEHPIRCGDDLITWLKVNRGAENCLEKFQLFKESLICHKESELKHIKTAMQFRKVFSNIYFKYNKIFLGRINKMLKPLTHFVIQVEETESKINYCYMKFEDNYNAIKACVIGYNVGENVKFMKDNQFVNKFKEFKEKNKQQS